MTEREMVGLYHRHNGHEFEQTLGDSEGQGRLVCCSSQGYKESDMTEQQQKQATMIRRKRKVSSIKGDISEFMT